MATMRECALYYVTGRSTWADLHADADRFDDELAAVKVAYGKMFNENAALEGELDDLRDELAAAKARNERLSRSLGTTCWQCEKCGEVRDSRPCVYCELAALKAGKAGSVSVPLDQWRRLVELAAAWNSGDCCAAIADDMAGIIAKIGVQHE